MPLKSVPDWGPGRASQTTSKSMVLSLSIIDIWGRIILFCRGGGCPGHCRIFNSIPGLYPLDASSIHETPSIPRPSDDNQKCLQTWLDIPWGGQNHPRLRSTVLEKSSLVCFFPSVIWVLSGNLFTSRSQWNLVS